ncbi:MAG: hypothetical protein WBG73_06660 [Coleofasciculaceae cyanobacterium]
MPFVPTRATAIAILFVSFKSVVIVKLAASVSIALGTKFSPSKALLMLLSVSVKVIVASLVP